MSVVKSLPLIGLMCITSSVSAIEPVYEGEEGIKQLVFATNCLACHSSDKSGTDRNDAPFSVNFDTYAAAVQNAEEAINETVNKSDMPPLESGIPKLTEDQKNALLAWRQGGFLQFGTNSTFDFSTNTLTLPVVQVGQLSYQVTLKFVALPGSSSGIGFQLESAIETSNTSDTAATFVSETGLVVMPSIDLINSPSAEDKVSAEMRLQQPVSEPFIFELTLVQ